ncbi:DNA-binding transcriptional regulator, XRE-family HTH domain [Sphingobacterium nematocida]|uniref:DNA-binding transcriptional regulator, XRE-family HTH domain n=1 Tax=Sphingobacterium nematocida TaxID=1513896 RepID=A0A1T5EL09_9SPHI|nr:helix-turn-helix transcriptional regulator [Sphingobacterium nematocida]SKB84549.1 DNA-binding transcriptional regulator, XRE-family HTH domain [Sphingobacterium nematocida]
MAQSQYRDQEYLVKLGNHIKAIREKKGLSQEDLAELCDVDTRQIGRIERAETNSTISILKKIADKLNINISQLLDF